MHCGLGEQATVVHGQTRGREREKERCNPKCYHWMSLFLFELSKRYLLNLEFLFDKKKPQQTKLNQI